MKIIAIDCGDFKADGGAVFGVIPKTMWQKMYPADDNNLCTLSMRSLLIDTGDRKILIDTGTGTKQDERFFKYHYLHGDGELFASLKKAGYNAEDITDVLHTHLHFDHCGGTIKKSNEGDLVSAFPNANLWVSKIQWDWAINPNRREAPAYPPENILPMQQTGCLRFIEEEGAWLPGIEVRFAHGHTRGQIIPFIKTKGKTIVYCADLIPTMANVPLSFISAYDLFQLDVLKEKEQLLQESAQNGYVLFFEHDAYNPCCTLVSTHNGVKVSEVLSLSSLDIL